MPTHTFIADDANAAVKRIRAELGPSAVVRSVRKLPRTGFSRLLRKDQIEVVASVEEAPVPTPPGPASPSSDPVRMLQEEMRLLRAQVTSLRHAPPETRVNELSRCLADRQILPQFHESISSRLPARATEEQIDGVLRKAWRSEPEASHAAIHLFVGVPGAGKSTILCKMLAQTSLVEQQPATIYHLDSHVANTSSQPAIFAEIVRAQYERTWPENFERREESVFVDLPGVSVGDRKGLDTLKAIIGSFGVPEIHLVLNAAYEPTHLLRQTEFFAELGITDLIVSHLDEEPCWGKIWNLVFGTKFAIRYLSEGQNVPGGLHQAVPDLIFQRQN